MEHNTLHHTSQATSPASISTHTFEDEQYMKRCILLARAGLGRVAPNPLVGAVIVVDGRIIGEGYHACYGKAHAEVNAIASVRQPELLKRATIYVSLEPCAHHGKTPPCADLIIERGIPRVVVGCVDPFSQVAGRGIERLRAAGREVVVGVLQEQCLDLVKRFIMFHTHKRPYVILKWAKSADGFIDRLRSGGTPAQLSSPLGRMAVHKLRSEVDAILVGARTALLDNPSLTVRDWSGKNPVRVVLASHHTLPDELHLLDGNTKTLIFSLPGTPLRTEVKGVEHIVLDSTDNVLEQLLSTLHAKGLQTLLIEGGNRLLQSFIDRQLWDEARVEHTPILLEEGVEAPRLPPHLPCHVGLCGGNPVVSYLRKGLF